MKLNTNTLKIIGIISMLVAHITYLYINENTMLFYILTFISRYTVVIFSYLLIVGFIKTKNIKKYIIRLLIFGVLSQPFFNYFLNNSFLVFKSLNIMFTMLLTLIALWIQKNEKDKLLSFSYILCLYIISLLCDWGLIFLPMTFIFYINKDNKIKKNIYLSILLSLYALIQDKIGVYLGFFIQLFFINLVDLNKKNKLNLKYFFYMFYPLHFLILRLIYILVY